jgi:hypothetical protein
LSDVVEKIFDLRGALLRTLGPSHPQKEKEKEREREQQRALADERLELSRAMQQSVPSSSWISQQTLAALEQLCALLREEKEAEVNKLRTSNDALLAAERKEKEEEMEKLLQELIEAKMNHAVVANECEEVNAFRNPDLT